MQSAEERGTVSLIRRVAFLSLHTSPMEQPGSGDAGGMNVYVRALAAALAETGVEVEIFTRSTSAGQPAVEHPDPGVCVHNVLAGPPRKLPKEELPELLHSMVAEIDRIRAPAAARPLRRHPFPLLGLRRAGLELAELWGCPLVHTMHTMAKVKNLLLRLRRTARAAAPRRRRTPDRRRRHPADRQHQRRSRRTRLPLRRRHRPHRRRTRRASTWPSSPPRSGPAPGPRTASPPAPSICSSPAGSSASKARRS